MSVPFSNTHLRVPRGFGTILEGLAREVLRDQPEDIPKYAAHYFEALLKQRDESGMDPAEWAAKLEDRFYNNHAFKASPEKEATEATVSKGQSHDSQNEDESSHSVEALNLSTTQPNVSEKVDLTGSTRKEEEECAITGKQTTSSERRLSEEESVNRLPDLDVQPDELNRTAEERDPVMTTFDQVDRAANEKDSSSVPDQDIPQPTAISSFRGISSVDVCAQELGMAEDEGGDKQETEVVDKEITESEEEEKNEVDEVFPYSGLADVDVCATELGGLERTIEGASAENDTHVIEEESSKPQPEETVLEPLLSQSETPEGNQQVAEDQAETQEEQETETETSGEMHQSLTHIGGALDSNVIPKEDSLVEISFEDIPEAQQIKDIEEKQPEEEDSAEVLQTKILEMQQEEECGEVTAVATDQNTLNTQDHEEPEMVGVEKKVNSEGEEVESQHEESDVIKEMVDANNSNLNDSEDDEQGEGVKTIISSPQPSSEADEENLEDETDHNNEDNTMINEFHQNEPNEPEFNEDETTDTVGGVKDDIVTEGYCEVEDQENNDGGGENHSSQVTQSNTSTAAMEAESETLEGSSLLWPEENEESQRTLVELQPEDAVVEKEVTSKERTPEAEGLVEEEKMDSEIQEESDAMCEEGSISLTQSADGPAADHQGEERPLGSENTTEPEGSSGDKQEDCSRPQEEEDIMDIPLDDPEANRAAAKIQAGFRGHMTRKKMKPEDKAEGEEVSSTGDVLNGSQGDTETGGSGAVERDDTSVPEQ